MRYNSIGEYFYKLSNRCLVLALLPVVLIWIAFVINQKYFSGSLIYEINGQHLYIIVLSTGIMMASQFWFQRHKSMIKLNYLQKEPSLGMRMKGYSSIVIYRFYNFSLMLLFVGVGIFISTELTFLFLIPIPIISFLLYWPSRWRMSRDLHLKVEEQQILRDDKLGV